MRRLFNILTVLAVLAATLLPAVALAQGTQPKPDLLITTLFPSQVIGPGEKPSFDIRLRVSTTARVVALSVQQLPTGWTATLRGGGNIVQSAYVEPDTYANVTLGLTPPGDVQAGAYRCVLVGDGGGERVELPLDVTIKENLPPKLTLTAELPTLGTSPTGSVSYSATLKNEGAKDLTVNLTSEPPAGFRVTFQLTGQDVTSSPVATGATKYLTIVARPYLDVKAGSYPFKVRAQGENVEASLDLVVQITGEVNLSVTSPDGRLSGKAYAGRDTPLKVVVRNTGSSQAGSIQLSSSEPEGWTVTFEPAKIDVLDAGQEQQVTATIRPSEKALAGDYMLSITAMPQDSGSKSAEFRITVLTSTLWGIVGVVGLAVTRFGRR